MSKPKSALTSLGREFASGIPSEPVLRLYERWSVNWDAGLNERYPSVS